MFIIPPTYPNSLKHNVLMPFDNGTIFCYIVSNLQEKKYIQQSNTTQTQPYSNNSSDANITVSKQCHH